MLKSVSQRLLRRIETRMHYLYGDVAHSLVNRLFMMVGRYGVGVNGIVPANPAQWDERDIMLITYGDMVHQPETPPLQTLHHWVRDQLGDAVNHVHILPFFPYSSDDGFSVKDYRIVDPALGTWREINAFRSDYRLMFDLVINHVSRRSVWFRDYVNDIAPYRHFFHEVDPNTDLSDVVRPRALPLLSETPTRSGKRHVWTTFSEDQVDVNFANPEVLFEYLDILLWYISHGASVIRLDAIAYLWKIPGTSCIHLTQTHEVVKLLRDVIDMVAPHVWIITETNVPHEENISYFGNGDEAHMVYQFSLPPLLAHGLLTGNAEAITRWAASLPDLGPMQTFFNFTASHDGVGVRPLQGLISDQAFQDLVAHVGNVGGRVNYKRDADGSESPYELNCTYFDLFADHRDHVTDRHRERFLSSQAVMLAQRGVPAVYFNSLFGGRNDVAAVEATGHNRRINRQKWDFDALNHTLSDSAAHESDIFKRYRALLDVRRQQPAFHPDGPQHVLQIHDACFAFERHAPDESQAITHLTNFAEEPLRMKVGDPMPHLNAGHAWHDLLQGKNIKGTNRTITLAPWQSMWLVNRS